MVNDIATPFSYSAESGFFVQGTDNTQYPIQHCPWCGAALTTRVGAGPIAPADEYARILDNAKTIRKPEECIEVFGQPDYDKPFPDNMGVPTDIRNIEYYSISDWYTLEFYFETSGVCRFAIHAKPKPLSKNAEQ